LVLATEVRPSSAHVSENAVVEARTTTEDPVSGWPDESGPQPPGETEQNSGAPDAFSVILHVNVTGVPSSTTTELGERVMSGLN